MVDPESLSLGALLLLTFAAGLVSFVSPCVLPLVPAYLSHLAGRSAIDAKAPGDRWRTFRHAVAFVVGLSALFIFLGASVGLLGSLIPNQVLWRQILRQVAGVVLVIMGLHLTGLFRIPFLYREARVHVQVARDRQGIGAYAQSALVGAAFGCGWSPCIGPMLGFALTLAGESGTVGRGTLLLITYALGLGIPFLLIGLTLNRARGLLHRLNKRLELISRLSGVFLIIMGLLIFFDQFTQLNILFARLNLFAPVL